MFAETCPLFPIDTKSGLVSVCTRSLYCPKVIVVLVIQILYLLTSFIFSLYSCFVFNDSYSCFKCILNDLLNIKVFFCVCRCMLSFADVAEKSSVFFD